MDAGLFQQPKYQVEARAVEGTSARHIETCRCRSSRPSERKCCKLDPAITFVRSPSISHNAQFLWWNERTFKICFIMSLQEDDATQGKWPQLILKNKRKNPVLQGSRGYRRCHYRAAAEAISAQKAWPLTPVAVRDGVEGEGYFLHSGLQMILGDSRLQGCLGHLIVMVMHYTVHVTAASVDQCENAVSSHRGHFFNARSLNTHTCWQEVT